MTIWKSLSPWERLKDSWQEYFHGLYAILVIGGFCFANFQEATEFKTRAVLVAVLIYFVVLLVFLIYFAHAYARKARYAEAMASVHDAVHALRDVAAYLRRCEKNEDRYEYAHFLNASQSTLDAVSTAFTLVTGTKCRAAIKIMGGESDNGLFVKTLCRDAQSAKRCEQNDKGEGLRHLVSRNTDYNMILHNGKNYFLHNTLNDDPNYLNTSKETYGGKLPYSAAIVLPIWLTAHETQGSSSQKILGFLAVDSASRKTFTIKYDVQMGAIVADALYPVLDLWYQVHDRDCPDSAVTPKEVKTSW